MLDAISVIAQYARDQAVASARDHRAHGEHIFVWSRRRTVSSCRINILRSPDHYNRRMVYKQVWAGLECMPSGLHTCTMRRRPDIQHNNYFLATSLKLLIKKSHQ